MSPGNEGKVDSVISSSTIVPHDATHADKTQAREKGGC